MFGKSAQSANGGDSNLGSSFISQGAEQFNNKEIQDRERAASVNVDPKASALPTDSENTRKLSDVRFSFNNLGERDLLI